jgi:hypothetical protein
MGSSDRFTIISADTLPCDLPAYCSIIRGALPEAAVHRRLQRVGMSRWTALRPPPALAGHFETFEHQKCPPVSPPIKAHGTIV